MKTIIKLNWLHITNFKGIKELAINNFSDESSIYGQNEAGKTTVSDAWHWLLTGKDSLDREKFSIKNTVDVSLNRSNHEVEAGITVNGEEIKLKRIYKENWVKPKGQIELELKGNVQEFFYNDVPFNATDFQKKINAFLDENILKMLTNPFYFNRLKWQDQRAVLFNMAGNITDSDIAESRPEFKTLLAGLNNKTLIDYKKQIGAQKNLLKDAVKQMPTRIDEATRSLPEVVDYKTIEQDVLSKQNAIADIDILINDETAAFNLKNQANNEHTKKIHALQLENINEGNSIRSNQEKIENDRNFKIQGIKNKIQTASADIKSKNLLIESTQSRIDKLTSDKADLLTKFYQESDAVLEYDEHKFNCPTCKRALEPTDIESAKKSMDDHFTEAKNQKIAEINAAGKSLQLQIKDASDLINTIKSQVELLTSQLDIHQNELSELELNLQKSVDLDQLVLENTVISNNKAEIERLTALIENVAPVNITEQKTARAILVNEISILQTQLSGKDQRKRLLVRIEELKAEEIRMNQQIADYEGIEFNIAAFDKAKVEETEKRISGLFKQVKFKMYDITLDGNLVDTCVAMRKGVPYGDLNTAGKVQAGLDIIDALSAYYGVQAPVFIDCRESTTNIPHIEAQVINLIVSPKDKVLRVETAA